MSALFPDLISSFPDAVDSFPTWFNIVATDGPLIQQYQSALQAGNTTLANQILAQIPQGTQKIIKASDLNLITSAMLAVERFYKDNIADYVSDKQESWLNVINQFSYQGTWSNGTSYVTNNMVSYTTQGLTLLFIATSNPPLSAAPTNQTYWRVLTIQGQQGPSGPGLSYMQEWNNSTQYQENDAVTYAGVLWVALQSSQNIQPGTNSSYWQSVISFEATTYPIQDTEPLNQDVGGLWFNTQNNPTQYYYLETLDNPITQEMVPAGYQTYGAEGVVLNGTGPLPIASGGTGAVTSEQALINLGGMSADDINAALSNKADSSMGYLPGESDIFAWAEQQQISCCFLVGSQVTNTPEPGFYVGELSIGAKGYEFRSIKLTQNTTGKTWVSVYMTITGEWVWTDWIPYATATPPQEYDLPLADGLIQSSASWYSKDQFGQVHVHGAISAGSGSLGWDTLVATLPEGYRPSAKLESAAAFASGGENGPGAVAVSTDGTIKVFPDISAAQKIAYFDLFFSAD